MSVKIDLDKNKYNIFVDIAAIFKNTASDFSIVNGRVFQFTEIKNVLYDIDMKELIGENTIYLNMIPNKFDLLDLFKRQHCAVSIEITDKKYKFKDVYSSIDFLIPDPRNMICRPAIADSDNVTNATAINTKELILEYKFEQFLLERLNAASSSKSLDTHKLNIKLNEGIANFILMMGDNNNKAMMMNLAETNCDETYKGIVQFPLEPLQIRVENITLKLYKNYAMQNKNMLTLVMETTIGKEPEIPIKMYTSNELLIPPKKD